MEMGRNVWIQKCVAETELAGFTELGGERRKRLIWFLQESLSG